MRFRPSLFPYREAPTNGGNGYTLVELLLVAAVIGLVVAPLSRFVLSIARGTVGVQLSIESQDEVRKAMTLIETEINNMTDIDVAEENEIVFRMPVYSLPGWSDGADWDGDGIPNLRDSDVDGDLGIPISPLNRGRVGFNVSDDDNDGVPGIDMRVRYFIRDTQLVRDVQFNDGVWGASETVVLSGLGTDGIRLTYFGNVNELAGSRIDLGDDGLPGTSDPGEGDRIITAREIDGVSLPQGGVGNGNGRIDTAQERAYICSISIVLSQDRNGDGTPDFRLKTEISPPLLPVRRSLP